MDLNWVNRIPSIISRAMNRRKEAKAQQAAEEAQAEVREMADRIRAAKSGPGWTNVTKECLIQGDMINTPIHVAADAHVMDAAMMTPRLQNLRTQLQNPPGPGAAPCCFCGADVHYKALGAANCPRCHRVVCGSHKAPSLARFQAMKRICPDCLVKEIKVILMNGSVEITGEEMIRAASYTLKRKDLEKAEKRIKVQDHVS